MPQSVNFNTIPSKSYLVLPKVREEERKKNESYIPEKPMSGAEATAHQLTNNFLTYFPKGFSGSKNSDFYEFLSMGMVPYIAGSATLVALYGITKNKMSLNDSMMSSIPYRNMAAGVILYAVGKWLSPKLSRIALKHTTGVDLDMRYINKVNELPENGNEKGLVRVQKPKVFDSVTFYRKDLLDPNNTYSYYDKIAKKAGYHDKLNAPNQTMGDKIKDLKVKATSLEDLAKYVAAACGVAIGAQKAFGNLEFTKIKDIKGLRSNITNLANAFKESCVQLWQGTKRNAFTKHAGKALILASIASTLLAWLIPMISFKTKPDTMKSKVDETKEFEVC